MGSRGRRDTQPGVVPGAGRAGLLRGDLALHRQALLLSIEEGEARLLGVRVGAMRLLLLMLATMTVAAVVSVTGLISFVGLLAPHSARLLAGHNRARPAC